MFMRTVPDTVDVRAAQQGTMVLDAPGLTPVTIPGGSWLLDAAFVRSGSDLILTGDDGAQVVVRGYFTHDFPPDLTTEDGAVISGHLAEILAGSPAPGQTAQAAPVTAAEPIGSVKAVDGVVTIVRTDGTSVSAENGTSVFQGDTIETGEGAAIGVTFVDDTTFSLGEDGRMVIDELVYDSASKTGAFKTALVQGVFSFVSGQIAKTGEEAMVLTTPVATIGIRGTKVAGRAAQEGAQNTIALLPETDAQGNISVGELTVSNQAGTVTLNQIGATVQLTSAFLPPPPPVVVPIQQLEQQFGTALNALPDSPAPAADDGGDQATDEEQDAEADAEAAPEGEGEGDGEDAVAEGEAEAPVEEGDVGEEEGLPPEGPVEGEEAAQAAGEAFEQALAEGATEEEAGAAAVDAAREEALAQGASEEGFDAAAAAAEAAYAEAIAGGATPEEAMAAAQAAASQAAAGFGPPDGGAPDTGGIGTFGPDPFGGTDPFGGSDMFGTDPFAGAPIYTGTPEDVFGPEPFDPGFDYALPTEEADIFGDNVVIDYTDNPDSPDLSDVVFGEEFGNTSGSDTFHGNTENTEYIYAQNEDGSTLVDVANGGAFAGGGVDTILDDGGANDRLTFEALDNVAIKMAVHPSDIELATPTAMQFTVYDTTGMTTLDNGGGVDDLTTGTLLTTVNVSTDVEDIQGSADDLASPDAGGVVLGGAMDLMGMETAYMVAGGANADTIDLSHDSDAVGAILFGKGGNDTLTGVSDSETVIYGGDGDDTIDGKGGANALFGGEGNDVFTVTETLSGNVISGGNGVDTVCYAGHNAAITGAFYSETVAIDHGNGHADNLTGVEILSGSANDDTFMFYGDPSSTGLETVIGGDGADTFTISSGLAAATTLDGGAGSDTLYKAFDATYTGTASNIENAVILGTAANDTIVAASDFAGNMVGGVAVGAVYAGDGDDSVALLADTANEMVIDSAETITATGTGADIITLGHAATSGAIIDLGGDSDMLNVVAGSNLLELSNVESVTMAGIGAQHTVTFGAAQNNEMTVTGSSRSDDTLVLASGVNTLTANNIENITGGINEDVVTISGAVASGVVDLGGSSNDELTISNTAGVSSGWTVANTESIVGGAGNEAVTLSAQWTGSYLGLGAGTDSLTLADGGNTITVDAIESVTGGSGDDAVTVYAAQTGATYDLGAGTEDSLTLADGTNSVTATGVEAVVGGTGTDTVYLTAGTSPLSLTGVENVYMSGAASQHTLTVTNLQDNNQVFYGTARGDDALTLSYGGNGHTVETHDIETITTGASDDTVDFYGVVAGGSIDMGDGTDELWLTNNADETVSLTIANAELIAGDNANETFTLANAYDDYAIDMGAGTDTLILADGTNQAAVGGVEVLVGGTGNDTIAATATDLSNMGSLDLGDDVSGDQVIITSGAVTNFAGALANVEKVSHNATTGNVSIAFDNTGLSSLISLTTAGATAYLVSEETSIDITGLETMTNVTSLNGVGDVANVTYIVDAYNLSQLTQIDTFETIGGGGTIYTNEATVDLTNIASATNTDVVSSGYTGGPTTFLVDSANLTQFDSIGASVAGSAIQSAEQSIDLTNFVMTSNMSTVESTYAGAATFTVDTETFGQFSNFVSAAADGTLQLADGSVNADLTGLTLTNVDNFLGGAGNDNMTAKAEFLDGAALNVTGGGGNDSVTLTYSSGSGVTLDTSELANINGFESLTLGSDNHWFLYPTDDMVAPGANLSIDTTAVTTSSYDVLFAAETETDGTITYAGGGGDDKVRIQSSMLEGAGGLSFTGGGENTGDELYLFANANVNLDATELGGINQFELIHANDDYEYTLTLADGNTAAGQTLNITRSTSSNPFTVDGSAELDGNLGLFGSGGADNLTGGAGNDILVGYGGQDQLTGGGGSDVYRYSPGNDYSTPASPDTILGFDATDASEDIEFYLMSGESFSFLGDETVPFTTTANLVEAHFNDTSKLLEADLDFDGVADVGIVLDSVSLADLDATDFTVS